MTPWKYHVERIVDGFPIWPALNIKMEPGKKRNDIVIVIHYISTTQKDSIPKFYPLLPGALSQISCKETSGYFLLSIRDDGKEDWIVAMKLLHSS